MPVVFNQKKKKKHSKYFKVFLRLGGNGAIWGGETLYMGRNILLAPTACICAPSRERDGMDCKQSIWMTYSKNIRLMTQAILKIKIPVLFPWLTSKNKNS